MSSKPNTESREHLEQRKTLITLHNDIEALEIHVLDPSQLDQFNIQREHMSLDRDLDSNPRFFTQNTNIPEPDDEVLDETVDILHNKDFFTDPFSRAYALQTQWGAYTFSSHWISSKTPWRSMSVSDYRPFRSLYKYDEPSFGVVDIMDVAGAEYPHITAATYISLHERDSSSLSRGELLIILRIMLAQLRKARLLHHTLAPILILAFVGNRARMLESYFDGKSLLVRSSDFYEFSDRKSASVSLKTLTEWYLGDPTGKTV